MRKPVKRAEKNRTDTILNVTVSSTLLNFLLANLHDKSRTTVKSLLTHRQISVDHKIETRHDLMLIPGQIVRITRGRIPEETHYPGIKILFEDNYIVVIEKEAGILSIATDKESEKTAYSIVSNHVKQANPKNKIFVIHRLDRETSGLMLFAKNKIVQDLLQNEWKQTIIKRTYFAVVEGTPDKQKGTIISWLKENKALKVYSSQDREQGQKAITHYEVIKQNINYSLLEVNLETGRKNQIRAHMQDIGHSIAGDKKYGAKTNPLKRLGLHAGILAFFHPKTGNPMHFEVPVPAKFLKLF